MVWDQQVFLTAAVRVDPAGGKDTGPEVYRGGGGRRRSDLMQATYRWQILCMDSKTGKIRWQQTAHTGHPSMPRHSAPNRQSTTGYGCKAGTRMQVLLARASRGRLQLPRDAQPSHRATVVVIVVDNEILAVCRG